MPPDTALSPIPEHLGNSTTICPKLLWDRLVLKCHSLTVKAFRSKTGIWGTKQSHVHCMLCFLKLRSPAISSAFMHWCMFFSKMLWKWLHCWSNDFFDAVSSEADVKSWLWWARRFGLYLGKAGSSWIILPLPKVSSKVPALSFSSWISGIICLF